MTNTPLCTPPDTDTGQLRRRSPRPSQPRPPPPGPAPRHWTLYKQLAHAHTLAEHSIQPYTEAAYVERMLQDCTKYKTEVLEGHTGQPDTTSRTTWDNVVPDRDIGALAMTVCTTFEDCSRPDHAFWDNNDPVIPNAIPAYHSWSTQQRIDLNTPHDHQRWSSTCTKMQPPKRTASPAFGQRCHNRYRSRTYPPAQQNPKRPRNTNTSPRNKGTAHQPTKRLNPPAPPRPSNNSTSPSPRVTSRTTTNYPERGTTQGAQQRHGDYRRAPSIGRKSSQG